MQSPALPAEFLALSARVGANPLWIQGAGGNTSFKDKNRIWVKASGMLLEEAERTPMFVPLDLAAARTILAAGSENFAPAVIPGEGPASLRPSIETALHTAMPHAVVVHLHAVSVIAEAIRADAAERLARKLDGLAWVFAPYARPGLPLSNALASVGADKADVVVMANHGLIVGASSCKAAIELIEEVESRLRDKPIPAAAAPDLERLAHIAGQTGWRLPRFVEAHQIAVGAAGKAVRAGALFPDQVVFLGPGAIPVTTSERAATFLRVAAAAGAFPKLVAIDGIGVVLRAEATAGTDHIARCLGDLATRAEPAAPLVYLDATNENELLSWDAETYRQALERARAAAAASA